MVHFLVQVALLLPQICYAQPSGSHHNSEPLVVVSDVLAFWKAYDRFWQDTTQNPFEEYINMDPTD